MYFKRTKLALFIFLFSLSSLSYAQQGKDKAKTISASGAIVNEYTSVTADVVSGATSINVKNSNLNTNNRFAGPLAAGDLIMIIQLQGATINGTPTDSSWGTITNYDNSGKYEFLEVKNVPNSTTININCSSVRNNYTVSGKVEIVRIPRFTALTINSGGTLTADAWNGTQGGIISVEVQDNTIINGSIDASAEGFRGGGLTNTGYNYNITIFVSTSATDGGQKGESIAGYQTDYNTYGGMFGRGAPANGGGGGNSVNAAGGGGANAGSINAWTGNGNPDITTSASYASAWNLEYNGFASSTSSGGGRGGYTWGDGGPNPLTTAPGNPSWTEDNRYNHGGKGGRPLDYSTGRIFMGGGGGSGHENDNNGGAGGSGGGIIYVLSYGQVSGSGNIISNGQNGGNNNSSAGPGDGSGGGGAGGTIIVNSISTISVAIINANGGKGGSQIIGSSGENEGPGGGGGGGYIAISNGSPTKQTNGGANGTSNSPSMVKFPPDGATEGGMGLPNETINPITFSPLTLSITNNLTICAGQSTKLIVTGGSANDTYLWTPSTGLDSTNVADPIATPINTTKYIVTVSNGTCSGKDSTTVTILPKVVITHSTSDSVCIKSSVTLNAGGGSYTYSWSPITGLSCTNCSNPVASPSTTTTYTVIATNQYCSDTGIQIVKILSTPVLSINNTTICSGQSTKLNLTGGNANDTYFWAPITGLNSTSIANPVASPTNTSKYIVTVSNGTCSAKDSLIVTVIPKVIITHSINDSTCSNQSIMLNAGGSPAYSFTWNPSAGLSCTNCINPNANPTITTTYTVIATNQYCSDTGIQIVKVLNLPVLSINDNSICSGQSAKLNLTGGSANDTYSWTPSTSLDSTNIADPTANPVTTTKYIVTVSDGVCIEKDSTVITVLAGVVVTHQAIDSICPTKSVTLNTGGSSSYTYSWSPSAGLSCTNCTNPIATPTSNTTYIVIASNQCGSDTGRQIITVLPLPIISINDTTICYGQITQLNVITNGTLNWSPASYLSCTACNNPQITPFSSSTYTITATLGACITTDIFSVTIDKPIVYAGNDTTINEGSQATLHGTGPSTFVWSPSDNLSSSSNPNPVASPSVTTTYTLVGFDSFGCSATSNVVVFIKNPCEFPMLPNAFSPNNDGNNDVYRIMSPFVDKLVSFRIYNRWGQLVFETSDLNIGWDGKFNGYPEQVGAYVYYLNIICQGTNVTYKGNVTLLR